ncbi:response regulator transcription factor [endosymbiont 'TC1' of Trimyema compressum]|uniref:response regulator transcription factor n=1 Tax=endosymbiont 'TC1' of Trimyema compressum TaxID=243899 RepID=UPI000A89E90E
MRVLIVEDEPFMAEAIEAVLKKNNYSVDLAFDGEYGLDCALSEIYDVVILDIMLPKIDGFRVVQTMRRNEELMARIRALIRRQPQIRNLNYLVYEDLVLYPFLLKITCNNKEIAITLKESQVLEILFSNKNQIVSKNILIERIWGYESNTEDNHVEVYISFLRKNCSI